MLLVAQTGAVADLRSAYANSFSRCPLRNIRDHAVAQPCRGPLDGTEVPMPTVNWFFATLLVLSLCATAIAVPLLLGQWGIA